MLPLPGFELGIVVRDIEQEAVLEPQRHGWTLLSRVLRKVSVQGRDRLFDLRYKMMDYDSNGYDRVTI